jgi:hypothetical protein
MTSLTDQLDPKVANVGKLIGLLTQDSGINQDWFAHADTQLGNIPRRVRELLQLTTDVLGKGTTPAGVPGGTWYPIPNPSDNSKPTGFYLVAPPPPAPGTSPLNATVGLGVLQATGIAKLSITAYGYVPLFKLASDASPTFVIGTQPSSIGVVASLSGGETFKANGTSFTGMKLDVNFSFSSAQTPSMRLTFVGLKGGPAGVPSEYTSLQQLIDNIDPVGKWIAAVILQGTYWLDQYVGNSVYTIGDILKTACVLTVDGDGNYHLNLDYLKTNVKNPKVLAENFLFNLLHKLSESDKPIVPIPVGGKESGIYVIREKADGDAFDYGARLMINDIKVSGKASADKKAPPPEVTFQIGKWIAEEKDKDSWVARSLGQTKDFAQPGVSVYLLRSTSKSGECKPEGPNVTFKPRVELVSLGLDVYGGAGQPLFDINGYTMGGAELRVYLKQQDSGFIFGAGASIDDLGIPLGPGFGKAAQGKDSNPVAQSLLESGKTDEKKDEKAGDGDKAPVNPTFSMSAAYVKSGNFVFQLYDTDGKPSDKVILPIQRALGPLQCQKIGLGWVQKDRYLSLLFDGGIHLDALSVDLNGLSVGIPVSTPGEFSKYKLDLDGMGLALKAGQVELSGAFVKLGPDEKSTPKRLYPEYNGVVMIKAGTFSITAIGSYAYVKENDDGYASLFIFGALEGKLGGPAFFYVTGLAAGFGYNRGLVLPDMDGVADFPLVAAASDPKKLGGLPPNPAKALQGLGSTVPAVRGNYWLAAGVRFTSFDLVNTTALLVVQFGQELEIALLGVSKITLPPPSASGASTVKYAYAELAMQVKLLPAKGFFSATAVLTPNSYVLDPACKLTGGFAFYVWFGDHENAGQFVLTLGGYHPDFDPPAHFPRVPRLGFNWPLPGNVTISGEAYFALTPSAIMAGAGLQVLYSAGNLQAWFKAQMDALVSWAPFYYRLDISISIGASYRINLLFVTTTLKVELGAKLSLWGPPMGGRVHINWYIISFTISFGADESQKPKPLKWSNAEGTGFSQTLLPHDTKKALKAHNVLLEAPAAPASVVTSAIFSVTANDGQSDTIQKDGKDVWIVRANHFVFSAVTTFPATEVNVKGSSTTSKFKPKEACGGDYTTVYIRPMNAEVTSSVFEVKMTDGKGAAYDLLAVFNFEISCQSVPAAKWGKPVPSGKDPEMNELLPKRLMGVEKITPKQATLSPTGALALKIDIAKAFTYRTVDEADPDHLPLAPGQTPVGPVPAVKADAYTDITKSLKSETVKSTRDKLLSTLQGYGFDPVTNSPMTTLAADPGAVLVGKPLILAA